jgi:DeoR family fructose operon transcriptional repressor
MFAHERIKKIKEIMIQKNYVNVSYISALLNVSEVTIRRDFEKLEQEEFLTRTHGGAIINEDYIMDDRFSADADVDPLINYRTEIGDISAHMVEAGDVVMFTPGITNMFIARKLSHKSFTAFTNDLNIALELTSHKNKNVVIPGGDIENTSLMLSGKLTEENTRKFYVNKAFVEVEGVDFSRGYTVDSISKASILKEMLNVAEDIVIVCTSKAFDKKSFAQLGMLDMSKTVVTNPDIPDRYKEYYYNRQIRLYTAFNSYEGDTNDE